MKVLNIEETPTTDGSLWLITLAKKDGSAAKPRLRQKTKPTFEIGYDIYSSQLVLKQPEGQDWYYEWKEGATQPSKAYARQGPPATRTLSKSPAEQESIKRQSARRDATELYKHTVDQGVPFNRDHFEELFGIMLELGDSPTGNPVVDETVKLGGKIVT
jgi:hypothetical protein